MATDNHITLTRENILKLRTVNGGFTATTLSALGFDQFPEKGWVRRLVGKTVTADQYAKAKVGSMVFRGKFSKLKEDRDALSLPSLLA